jgi:hypothetical protein
MNAQPDFFSSSIYQQRVLRHVDAPPPRTTWGKRRPRLVYLGKGVHTATAVAITAMLALPTQFVAGTESAQVIRPLQHRRPISMRKSSFEAVDHRRVQMRPTHVLAFRPVGRPTKALPRSYRTDPEA